VSSNFVTMVEKYCNGTLDTSKWNADQKKILDSIREIEQDFANVPTQWMCTVSCPCPESNSSTGNWYTKYTSNKTIDEYAATNFSRTVNRTASANSIAKNLTIFTI
jgi:hypothetical protein